MLVMVIPAKEGSEAGTSNGLRLNKDSFHSNFSYSFEYSFSTFCLDTKGGAQKSRQFDARHSLRCIPPLTNCRFATVIVMYQSINVRGVLRAMRGNGRRSCFVPLSGTKPRRWTSS